MNESKLEEGSSVALFGFGVTGRSVATALVQRNVSVVVFDDNPDNDMRGIAEGLGISLITPAESGGVEENMKTVDFAIPTPGLPESHDFFECAARKGIPIISEFDLAAQWDDRPILAITGTNGKTTVSTMVDEMLQKSGVASAMAGNSDIPLVSAIDNKEIETIVVEASSFRLSQSQRFKPHVAAWLNFAPDHLNVHKDLETYENAKKVIWRNLGSTGIAVANIGDEIVRRNIPPSASTITFGLSTGDSRVDDETLVVKEHPLLEVSELVRKAPHDILNALAAATIAIEGGATSKAIQEVLTTFSGLPHRMTYLGSSEGVGWYNDSKSTTPHSVAAAVQGFDNVVLIAGGQNKGIDLSPLGLLDKHLKSVIALGEVAEEISQIFHKRVPVKTAETMENAVNLAYAQSQSGDLVILSPGCASFDLYRNYKERGKHFSKLVDEMILRQP